MGSSRDTDTVAQRTDWLLEEYHEALYRRTDRLFAAILGVQWLIALAFAFAVAPRRWAGVESAREPHLWLAFAVGCGITAFPVILALKQPGKPRTRYVIAGAQMLMSALLIHLTRGRIETHFHVFGSLAFLAIYNDWRVLAVASATIVGDHLLRAVIFPISVYGSSHLPLWRTLEHAGWLLFSDIFLVRACVLSEREARELAVRQARLEDVSANIESRVLLRTAELRDNEERYRTLVTGSPIAIMQIDGRGSCLYANDLALKLLGLRADQIIGQTWTDSFNPLDRPKAEELAARGGGVDDLRTTGDARVLVRVGELGSHGDGVLARIVFMERIAA